ncbi:MAG: peptidase S58 family protein [Alphaproteobacteria bacterium]|nr:MAG: peptidase S58 family protein [Alphaproteobacteria bacterium]
MPAHPGPQNLITDVSGISVGNAVDALVRTGVSVVLPERRAVMGVDVRGGGPGTRETDALDPTCLVDEMDAVVLAGGSVYGLEAASGVVAGLGAQGRGFEVAGAPLTAPVVPSAILFDLANGGDKAWGTEPPYRRLGLKALAAASNAPFDLGNQGAGYGARAGAYKGGLGSASIVTDEGIEVGALVAVNAFGSPVVPGHKALWAAPFAHGDEMGPQPLKNWPGSPIEQDWPRDTKTGAPPGSNTTIGVIATNVSLTPAQAKRLAIMGQDGFARAIRPIHAPQDGDTLFAISTATRPLGDPGALALARLGLLAADCVTRAIGRAIWAAESQGDLRSFRDQLG